MTTTGALVPLLAIALTACSSGNKPAVSSQDGGSEAGVYTPCDAGCDDGSTCAYPMDGGCGAIGFCVPVDPNAPPCKAYNLCGCDGVIFLDRCDLPFDYSPAPTAGFAGACSSDASEAAVDRE